MNRRVRPLLDPDLKEHPFPNKRVPARRTVRQRHRAVYHLVPLAASPHLSRSSPALRDSSFDSLRSSHNSSVPVMHDLSGLHWRSKRVRTSLSHVPRRPGLYAYGHDNRDCLGLTAARTYVYIGQTDNLRRRLEQHLPRNEVNIGLRTYLETNSSAARCWFCVLPDSSSAVRRSLEATLIRFFNPKFNTHSNPKKTAT